MPIIIVINLFLQLNSPRYNISGVLLVFVTPRWPQVCSILEDVWCVGLGWRDELDVFLPLFGMAVCLVCYLTVFARPRLKLDEFRWILVMDLQQLFTAFRDHTGGGTTIQREPASVARDWFTWSISDWFVECCSSSLENHMILSYFVHVQSPITINFWNTEGHFLDMIITIDLLAWPMIVLPFAHCIRSDRRDFNKFWPKLVSLLRRYSYPPILHWYVAPCFHTWERRFGTDCRGFRTLIEFDNKQCLIWSCWIYMGLI